MENWIKIPEYEGLYEVSDLGRVKRLRRVVPLPKGGFRLDKEKVMCLKTNRLGYFFISLSKEGISKTFKVHRLVMACFIGPSDLLVNHKNFIKADNRLLNLEYVTHQENFDHSRERHLASVVRGDRNHRTKIPCSELADILGKRGLVPCTVLAKKYGVHHSTISRIWRGCRE